MVLGLRILTLGLFIVSALIFRAEAQQTPAATSPKMEKIQQLVQELKVLRQQVQPLRLQMQQVMAQFKTLREELRPIEDKMKVDSEQLRTLTGS